MDILQRLQPLDILFAVIWAGIIGWGLQTGIIRQLGMLVGVYGAALVGGSLYRQGGEALALAFGRDILPQLELTAYIALFAMVFGAVGFLIWRAYPDSKFGRGIKTENIVGAALGAIWGVMFLIGVLTMLRFYTVVPWHDEAGRQQGVEHQIQLSQVAPVLEIVASPLWQVMAPWFPAPVNPKL